MPITLTRDSVAPGDDIHAPHRLQLPGDTTLLQLLHPRGPLHHYLPCVADHQTLWAVHVDGQHVADLRHSGQADLQARLLAADRPLANCEVFLHAVAQQRLG